MNELINDEAVYRTAPATPGLLKKWVRYEEREKKLQQYIVFNILLYLNESIKQSFVER